MTGKHIAEQLGLNYVFFCEFEELHSPLRSPELQVCMHHSAEKQHVLDLCTAVDTDCLRKCSLQPDRNVETVSTIAGRRCSWKCFAEQI